MEARFGETDPETADLLFARNMRLAIELRVAIREASGRRSMFTGPKEVVQ